jgi:hypothetical protein
VVGPASSRNDCRNHTFYTSYIGPLGATDGVHQIVP